jgi:hypothetical protein
MLLWNRGMFSGVTLLGLMFHAAETDVLPCASFFVSLLVLVVTAILLS